MDLAISWIIASKDFKIFWRKKNILYGTIIFPFLISILFPAATVFAGRNNTGGIPAAVLPGLLNAFSFFFVITAATLPTAIASYSIVGEKVEKSLEPLLATPTTDGEILLGKSIAAFIPPVVATWAAASLFMTLTDAFTYAKLGYLYFPNWNIGVVLLFLAPLAAILSIELNVIVSSRVSDVRSATQLGGVMFIPFMILYIASEIGAISFNVINLSIISAIILVVDLILFKVSTATFRREEILTKWK